MVELVELVQLTANLSGSGSGRVTSSVGFTCDLFAGQDRTCSQLVFPREQADLVADPRPGTRFVAWGGDAAACGTAPTCRIDLTADRVVDAVFEEAPQITIRKVIDTPFDVGDPDFGLDGDLGPDSVSPAEPSTRTVAPDVYEVGEVDLPRGWTPVDATCDDPDSAALGPDRVRIDVTDGDDVTCTFTNRAGITEGLILGTGATPDAPVFPGDPLDVGLPPGFLEPGSSATGELRSDPVTVFRGNAADDGSLRFTATVPLGTEAGEHLLGVWDERGNLAIATVHVGAPDAGAAGRAAVSGPGAGTLPRTGGQPGGLVGFAAVLLVAGGGLTALGRRHLRRLAEPPTGR